MPGAERDPGASARDGFTVRAVLFALVGTAALTGPALVGLDYGSWRGLDGGLALLLVVGVVSFGWPPAEPQGAARGLCDLSVGTGAVLLFGGLGVAAAGEAHGAAGPVLLAGGLAMVLVWTGRLGGWPGAVAAWALVALVGWSGGEEASAPAPGPAVELLPVELTLRGPLDEARLRVGDAPPLEIRADLGVGASTQVRAFIPVPAERPGGPVTPDLEAIFPPGPPVAHEAGAALADRRVAAAVAAAWIPDPRLASRPRPPVPPAVRSAPSPARLLGAWAALLLLLAIRRGFHRRRPWTGAALGTLVGPGSALVLSGLVPAAPGRAVAPEAPGVRALEGVSGAPSWLQVDRRRGTLLLDELGPGPAAIDLHGRPPSRCELDLTGPEGRLRLALERGAVADLLRPLDPGLRPLRPAINGWGDLDPAWLREPPAGWRALAPWGIGEAALSGQEGAFSGDPGAAASPPAWAHGGGEGGGWQVLGQLSGEGFKGLEGPGGLSGASGLADPDGGEVWLRVTEGPSAAGR